MDLILRGLFTANSHMVKVVSVKLPARPRLCFTVFCNGDGRAVVEEYRQRHQLRRILHSKTYENVTEL
jgi:hypothetical protein